MKVRNINGIFNEVATIVVDQQGVLVSSDAVAGSMFGFDPSELTGKSLFSLVPGMELTGCTEKHPLPRQKGVAPDSTSGCEGIGIRGDGTQFPVWVRVNRLGGEAAHLFVCAIIDLSDDKGILARLEHSLELSRAILETAVNPIVTIDSAGLIQSFNPAAERLFGYTSAEVEGRNVNILMPEPYHSNHDSYIARYQAGGEPRIIGTGREVEGRKKDGSTFPMHLSIGEMHISGKRMFVGIVADITELIQYEREVEQHRDQLGELVAIATTEVKAIVQTAVNGIITIKQDGKIQIFNPAAEKLFGWKHEEVEGRNVSLLMEEPYASQHDGYLARYLQSGVGHIIDKGREVVALRKDGSTFPAYLAVGHTQFADGQHYFVAFISDITPQKMNEHELIQAKEDAEAGGRAKAAFVANMSHEIRTPMNAIIGFAEVALQDTSLTPQTEKHVGTILRSARSLLGIINDILDISKMESGKFSLETVCFHLPNALADALSTVEHQAMEKDLALLLEYDAELAARFMGDPTRLRQVILNLVGNAIKFTEKGRVTVHVRPGMGADMLHFSVVDTGIGMTAAQVAKVFESFTQADESTTRRFGGMGLGTTISKQIVEMMGGRIWVESEPGKGTSFHFTVRMPVATTTDNCLFENGISLVEDYSSPRLFRILLAEDLEVNATLATLRLEQQGHTVHWVENGRIAVEAYQRGEYDLILMDVMMPELDGLDATRAIRRLEQGTDRHIPILALTASVMRDDYAKCLEAGMDRVEAKPIDFKHLFLAMEMAVPKGVGQTNTSLTIDVKPQLEVDFTVLEGIVDHAKAIRIWRVPEMLAKALKSFAAERGEDAGLMRQLLSAHPDDAEPARQVAHALKGVAGNLSLIRVADLARQLDTALSQNERTVTAAVLDELDSALAQAVAAISALHLPEAREASKVWDAQAVQAQLMTLMDALDSLDPDAVEPVLSTLAEYVQRSDLAPVQRCVDAFDFEQAKEEAANLAGKLGLSLE